MKTPILAALAVSLAVPAWAQQQRQCGPRDRIIEMLTEGFSEARQSMALATNGNLIETLANLETGSWTVIVSFPEGQTCIVAAGGSFQIVSEPAGVEG